MLFDYVTADGASTGTGTVWSRFPLSPLAPGALTPFSYSVLAEIASRAWYTYYDRLGFDPTPRSKVVRRHQGHVYFNLSLCAQLEAEHASVMPMPMQINGQPVALAAWEKPGFFAGFKVGRAQKRIDDTLAEFDREMAAITEKARAWYFKTQTIKRWGQAEVLQIMEEIERVGVDGMTAFLAARLNLGQHYARLAADLQGNKSVEEAALLINQALGNLNGLVEHEMMEALTPLLTMARTPGQHAWLLQANKVTWHRGPWEGASPSDELLAQAKQFLDAFGHRTQHEGELANARWAEDGAALYDALIAQSEPLVARAAAPANAQQALLDALPASARKQGEQSLQQMGALLKLQSRALHAIAYVWGGTRSWAIAAAHEAMVDERLRSPDEVFVFELEEIKQMMTGEWNVSSRDEIRAAVAQRQTEFAAIRDGRAPDVLVGDVPAVASYQGLPAVAGQATGPMIATNVLDSGYMVALHHAAGFVAAAGMPFDPFVVAAQGWSRPVAVGMGERVAEFGDLNGKSTALEVNAAGVKIS